MGKDDYFYAECIGIGLVKLIVDGKSTSTRGRVISSRAEITLDDDDLDELIDSLETARRMKVTISR